MSNIKTKQTLYGIFNEIQTRTDTKENLQSLYELFEATPIQEFNECLENVFLIIFYNYEKNTLPLKNIREFLKSFIEKISKSYEWMFLISHLNEVKDWCESNVVVTKENNISKIAMKC